MDALAVTWDTSTVMSPKIRALYMVRKIRIPNIVIISTLVLGPISLPPRARTAVYRQTKY